MGLFGNPDEKIRKRETKVRALYNFYKGIQCKVVFPQEELVLKSHGGLTRGFATLGLGLVGLAATSNVKQEKQRVIKDTILQVTDNGIVFKKVGGDGKDLRIPYDNIISFNTRPQRYIDEIAIIGQCELILLENQSLIIGLRLEEDIFEVIPKDLKNVINSRATGKDNEETGWGLNHVIDKSLPKTEKITNNDVSATDELAKVIKMYEQGFLTDEEFAAMKKKIIEE